MSDSGRPRGRNERWASDHERARQRAAERLSLPLPAAENGWLDRHLRMCAACATVAADYEAQQTALRALQEPLPPRDLWARTSAALDRAERQTGRSLPGPSVFPGRGGLPGSRGARSIRGLRAERRASAFRLDPRSIPPRFLVDRPRRGSRPAGLGWVAPFGALAALAIVIVVGGGSLLNSSVVTPLRSTLTESSSLTAALPASPFATPIQVGAGEVVWLTPSDDGSYSLNFASVDQVCPANAKPDCAPIAGSSPRNLPTVNSALHTVIRSPSHKQLVVVPSSTKKGRGGSVIVVAVPTQGAAATPGPSVAPVTASVPASSSAAPAHSPSGAPATAGGTPEPSPRPVTASGGTSNPSTGASPSDSSSGGASVPPASAVDSSVPSSTATAAVPTASDSVQPTATGPSPSATATTSADPTGSGATETPSAAISGSVIPSAPQPTAAALAIIDNVVVVGETASYSPDGTMLAFSARPADGSQGPDIYLWRPGDQTAHALTTDHASIFSGWLSNQLLGSRSVDDTGRPAVSSAAPTTGAPSSGAPSSGAPSSGAPSSAATDVGPTPSAASSESPSTAPATEAAPSESAAAEPAGMTVTSGSAPSDASGHLPSPAPTRAEAPAGAMPRSFVLDPVTLVETELAAPAWRPVVDPTGRFVAYWAGSLRYDAADFTWIPNVGALVLASWPALRGTDPNATLSPVPLLDNAGASVPAGEWDIRWDEAGSHIVVWAADADNPELGRLTLLTIDASGRVDPTGISLHDAPALAGFSIGNDRLAWATPPGQDGEGSRLHVLAWNGENAGNIDSQPVPGGDPVVVVR